MITVSIAINAQAIYTRTAVNVTQECGGTYGKGIQTYQLDDNSIIQQKYEDGAVKLAIKMLKKIREVKRNGK